MLVLEVDKVHRLLMIFFSPNHRTNILDLLITLIPEIRYGNIDIANNEEQRAVTMDPDFLLFQIKKLIRLFEELNHG